MKTTNAMQLKAKIKARAKASNVSPQLMMQDYLLERLLVRISTSEWSSCFILKGGMLIASLIGVDSRVTKDLDTTITGFALTHESLKAIFEEICEIEADDDLSFKFTRTEDIRETDDYPGIRVFLKALYNPMAVTLSVDVTTGDAITPRAIEYEYPLMFDKDSVKLMAYPVCTCLAEKLETVVTRGIANTRPRDYYDIVMLWNARKDTIDLETLREAITATCAKRSSDSQILQYRDVMKQVANDAGILARWKTYANNYGYVGSLTLCDACETVINILNEAL
jgi:predicted nucleotidyltransferase component of viral defense system